ncbi:MAG: DUF4157 domain-containing protein [Thioploca sp.]|nr:DUF4157 domain-containing protein [Thioploca sp.]
MDDEATKMISREQKTAVPQMSGILQRRAVRQVDSDIAPPIVQEVLRSSGRPLDDETRAFMEPRFGYDFSRVRVHTDDKAAESARAVNARAYTVGQHVVMRQDEYAPKTEAGRRLLAHELVHVIQQQGGTRLQNLQVGAVGDVYEREAEGVAEQVMRMPEPQVQRQACSSPSCKEKDEDNKILQTKSVDSTGSAQMADNPLIQSVLSLPGQPMDAATRSFMEPRFGQDFSGVRVHTDGQAVESVLAVNARAYTVGRDVVFGEGQYVPGTNEGQRLVAHELAHVGQQLPSQLNRAAKNNIVAQQVSNVFLQRKSDKVPYDGIIYLPKGETEARVCGPNYKGTITQRNCPVVLEPGTKVVVRKEYKSGWLFIEHPPQKRLGGQKFGNILPEYVKPATSESSSPTASKESEIVDSTVSELPPQEQSQNVSVSVAEKKEEFSGAEGASGASSGQSVARYVAALEAEAISLSTWFSNHMIDEQNYSTKLQASVDVFVEIYARRGEQATTADIEALKIRLVASSPRTAFENRLRHGEFPAYKPVYDKDEIVGYFCSSGGYSEVVDLDGKIVWSDEIPLETPLIDPIDLIPFELVGSLATKAATIGLRAIGKAGVKIVAKDVGKVVVEEGVKLGTKEAAEEVGKLGVQKLPGEAAKEATESITKAVAGDVSKSSLDALVQVFRKGEKLKSVGVVSLNRLRNVLGRAGVSPSEYKLVKVSKNVAEAMEKEVGEPIWGWVQRTGSGVVRDARGRPIINFTPRALASLEEAVKTFGHEAKHLKDFAAGLMTSSEALAEKEGEKLWLVITKSLGGN